MVTIEQMLKEAIATACRSGGSRGSHFAERL